MNSNSIKSVDEGAWARRYTEQFAALPPKGLAAQAAFAAAYDHSAAVYARLNLANRPVSLAVFAADNVQALSRDHRLALAKRQLETLDATLALGRLGKAAISQQRSVAAALFGALLGPWPEQLAAILLQTTQPQAAASR
ncbi:MAG: hypothetical protein EOO40_08015 [Deltaproteobacteria bacterium]|nr:MAG: hypothetical protein EOO40_08015 [Deltaproteobacteria bacterium]